MADTFVGVYKQLLDTLRKNPSSTIELTTKLGFTRQYIWERLKTLQTAGLVTKVKKGRQTKYSVSKPINTSTDITYM